MARYKPNHKEFGAFILTEEARRPAVQIAHLIAIGAKRTAPRSSGPGPHMADQYQVNAHSEPVIIEPGGPRAGAEVFNDDITATRVEFGNSRAKAQRPLGKAGAVYDTPKGV